MVNRRNDNQVLAATVWGEARNQLPDGRQAVVNVVQNRTRVAMAYVQRHGKPHPEFGEGTVRSACLAPGQFSCWNEGDPNLPQIEGLDFQDPDHLLQTCIDLAGKALTSDLPDITHGALFYKTLTTPWPHSWGVFQKPLITYGFHNFYGALIPLPKNAPLHSA